MNEIRITKYNPQFRDSSGAYKIDEWTSVDDIGEYFDGAVLTEGEYISVENAYVSSVLKLFKQFEAEYFNVKYVEAYGKIRECKIKSSNNMKRIYYTIRHGKKFSIDYLPDVLRLILREQMWCLIRFKDDVEVRIGYDYYMYAKCSKVESGIISGIGNMGLFAEEYPYPNVDRDMPKRLKMALYIRNFMLFTFRRLWFLFDRG